MISWNLKLHFEPTATSKAFQLYREVGIPEISHIGCFQLGMLL